MWGLGTAFVLGRSAWRIARFRRALRDAQPAPTDLQAVADGLAAAMGLTWSPRVLLVPGRVWPSLWMPGVRSRQAKVIVPAGLLPLLDADQRAAVLAHELAHLRRGDPWVRWLELLVCGLYWWYPLLGWFRRQLRESEEECCDMWVVAALAGRRAYATALVETAVFLGGPVRAPAPILASGAGPVRDLQRRVTMIMRATWPARLTRLGLLAVLCLGTAGLAFGPVLAQEKPDEGKKDPPPAKKKRGDAPPPRNPDESPDPRAKARLERASDEEIEKAQEEVDKARRAMQKASEKLRAAEQKLAKAEGRPANQGPGGFGGFPGGGFGGFPGAPGGGGGFPGGGNPDGGFPPAPGGGPGIPPAVGPRPGDGGAPGGGGGSPARVPGKGGPGGGFGGNNEFRDLQKQMAELRQQLEVMRRELRENRAGGRPGGGDSPRREPKDGPNRPRGGADNTPPPPATPLPPPTPPPAPNKP